MTEEKLTLIKIPKSSVLMAGRLRPGVRLHSGGGQIQRPLIERGFDPKKAILVGDSLTSDILGGKNAGVTTVWVNPSHAPARPDIQPDYEIGYLSQLQALLDTL